MNPKPKRLEIKQLTQEFYQKFNKNQYPEMLHKPSRPYIVLIAEIEGNTFAIPFRTEVNHTLGYKFS